MALRGNLFLWAILALPAILMVVANREASEMLHPTGEFSARLMIIAMCIGPMASLMPHRAWVRWLLLHRRHFGVAAFGYAVLHLVFYLIDMEWSLGDMMAELDAAGIWTGWVAMFAMLLPALASNQAAMRLLRQNWKRVQQFAYLAAVFTLAHWVFLSYDMISGAAWIHFAPLILLNLARLGTTMVRKRST